MALNHNSMLVSAGAGTPRRAYGYWTQASSTSARAQTQIRWPAATAAAIISGVTQSGWLISIKSSNTEGTGDILAGLYLAASGGVLHWFLRDAAAGDTDLGTLYTASDTWVDIDMNMTGSGTTVRLNNELVGTVAAAAGSATVIQYGQNGPDGPVSVDYYFRSARNNISATDRTLFDDGTLSEFDANVQNGATLSVVAAPGVNPVVTFDGLSPAPCVNPSGTAIFGFEFTITDADPGHRYTAYSARSDHTVLNPNEWWARHILEYGGLRDEDATTYTTCVHLPETWDDVNSGGTYYYGRLRLAVFVEREYFFTGDEIALEADFYIWNGAGWELAPLIPPYVPGDAGPVVVGAQWRFFVTDNRTSGLTMLDHWATDRTVTATLNAPWSSSGVVPSDSPEINILSQVWGSSGFLTNTFHPFLNEGTRLLYGFRREENPGDPPWVCRFGGMILQTSDDGESDPAVTTYTAYDPWQWLYSIPCLIPPSATLEGSQAVGDFPGPDGINFVAQPGSLIALSLLEIARQELVVSYVGFALHIDMPQSYLGFPLGGSGLWEADPRNVIEDTEAIPLNPGETPFNIPQGTSVGEAWDMLCATGTMDIVLRPVYDPINRPSITSEISIYSRMGEDKPGAPMAWDKPGHSLVGISHETDGTQRANNVRFMSGPGGPPAAVQTDTNSRDVYYDYWQQQFLPDGKNSTQVQRIAAHVLAEHADGLDTVQVTPASERSASPFLEYNVGDRVPVFASSNLRAALSGAFRVHEIPISISDNGVESVQAMTVVFDGEMGVPSPFATPLAGSQNDQVAVEMARRINRDSRSGRGGV